MPLSYRAVALLLAAPQAAAFAVGAPHAVAPHRVHPASPAMGLVRKVNTAEFEEAIQDCSTPIIVDVFATWCGPCQMMVPQLEAAAEHFGDRCRFLKIDSDEEPEVSSVLKISGLPTTLFISDMSVVARAEGMLMKDELTALTEHHFFGGEAPVIEGVN